MDCVDQPSEEFTAIAPAETPTKRHLRKLLAKHRQRKCRAKKKRHLTPKQVKTKNSLAEAERLLSAHLSGPALQLMLSQLTTKKKRWSMEEKKLCFSIYYKSPSCYRFLRKTFRMPSVRTLQRLYEGTSISCGFSADFQRVLFTKVKEMPERARHCVLSIDEMAIQTGLAYDVNQDCILGFEDMGDCGRSQSVAKQALVFMLCGLFDCWKQPIACFAVKSSTPGEILKSLIKQAVKYVIDIGFILNVVVMDQGPNNQKAMRLLGVTIDQPFILFNGSKIYFMYDPPHLLKSI